VNATQTIGIPLPEGVRASDDELAYLEQLCRAVVGLRYDDDPRWERIAGQLEHAGWQVNWGLTFYAEARRGGHVEQALGRTRGEAFDELCQLTLLDECGGCP
jgi:hypothetical protein